MPMLKPYDHTGSKKLYSNDYAQYGGGGEYSNFQVPVFAGATTQRGYGLGSMLSGLLKSAMPLVKRGAIAFGKTAARTGLNVLDDVIQGQNIKTAARQRIKGAGRELVQKVITRATHPYSPPKVNKRKRKASKSTTPQRRKKRKVGQNRRSSDIFS